MAHYTGKDTIRIVRKIGRRRAWVQQKNALSHDSLGGKWPYPIAGGTPPLWIVVVNGRRYDSFLYRKNALACVRRLKGKI